MLLLPLELVPHVEEPGRRALGEQPSRFDERLAEPRQARFRGAPIELGGHRPEVRVQPLQHLGEPPWYHRTEPGGKRSPLRAEHGEEIGIAAGISVGPDEASGASPGDRPDHPAGLGTLVGESDRVQLGERMRKPGPRPRDINIERPVLITSPVKEGERQMRPPALPGRKRPHVRGAVETPRRHPPGELVLAVPVARVPGEARQDDHRPLPADDFHDVRHRRFLVPRAERFVEVLRVAVVGKGGVVDPVEAVPVPGRLEFRGPDQPEPVEQLRPDGVRPRLAPGDAEERGAHPVAPAQESEERPVLVVGMRGDVQHRPGGLEFLDPVPGHRRPSLPRPGRLGSRRSGNCEREGSGYQAAKRTKPPHGVEV